MANSSGIFNSNELLISQANKPLGEILIEAGLITVSQIEFALHQQAHTNLRIGEILATHNWIKQETADFFAEKWPKIINQKQKKPLVYYFRHAGLLDDRQIAEIMKEQQLEKKPTRFHRLAVKKGYLKQITVDFFLANIFNIYSSNIFSFAKPYEILSRYNKGETNFRRAELSGAPLAGISLKGIQLDGSILRQANLNSCNLSDSSLIQADMAFANLVKAILINANLKKTNLYQANLKEAHLNEADFSQANLQQSNLTQAHLSNAIFAGADLRGAKLALEYSYNVYYDAATIFSNDFNPEQVGWKKID